MGCLGLRNIPTRLRGRMSRPRLLCLLKRTQNGKGQIPATSLIAEAKFNELQKDMVHTLLNLPELQ